MFEKKLSLQLEKIFDLGKVSFDKPGDSHEQEGVFVEVARARTKVKDAREVAHITGKIHMFAASNKLPFGYIGKRIDAAEAADKDGLFFYEFEENKGMFRNIVERSVSFEYLFDSQYDPAIGRIDSVNFTLSET